MRGFELKAQPITSLANPVVKRARRLRQRKGRQVEAAFLAEGLRVVLTAVEYQAPIEAVLYCPERLTSERGRTAVSELAERGIATFALSPVVFASLSERDNPVGLMAIVRSTTRPLAALPRLDTGLYVALDAVADPGNLGTVLRSLDAVGAAGLVLSGPGTDPFHPTAVRASLGALWTLPWALAGDLTEVLAWAREFGLATVATSARARDSFWDVEYAWPLLFLMGAERHGLPAEVQEAADQRVAIPMGGRASSLNVAVATALLAYEARRRLVGAAG